MENDLRMKIKAKLAKVNTAVAGMIDPEVDAEEKQGWITIYNGAMRKIMDEYLAEETPAEAPAEEPAEGEVPIEEDVGGITNAPEE